MHQGLHFISGLPRSGSTLLAALLRQNPRFHAGMTSPVGSLYLALEGAMSRRNEAAVFISDTQRRDLLRGLFDDYYREVGGGKVLFDTNRIWCAKLPALAQLFPDARVICCVRDIAWIMDSLERLARRNAFEPSGIYGFEPGTTVYMRLNRLATGDGMVGFALDALKEGFFGEESSRLILVEYEALARAPASTMANLYQLLGEPPFAHDFESVEYAADEFDLALGAPGLHHIRRKVEWVGRQTILPPELFRRFDNDMFWRQPDAGVRSVPVIKLDEPPPEER